MRYLFNLIYLTLLAILLICGIVPRLRRRDILGGFWTKFFGLVPEIEPSSPLVWVHAACVGESLVAAMLIRRLRRLRPDIRFVLTVSSTDGLAVARRELSDLPVFYAPYDFTWAVRRAYRNLSPALLIITENDVWPNLIGEAVRRGIPCALYNTRISPREEKEHAWNGWLIAPSLSSVRWWGVVDQQAAEGIQKYFGIGSPPVEITGLVKLDIARRSRTESPVEELRHWFSITSSDQVVVAGSTHPPEEEILLEVVQNLRRRFPNLRLFLAPRDITRIPQISELAQKHGFQSARFSQRVDAAPLTSPLVLVDTVGDLKHLWGLADIAFVGGSLPPHGGQNMAEPAGFAVPVCFGPHTFNFQKLAEHLVSAGGAAVVRDAAELELRLADWLEFPDRARTAGEKAAEVLQWHLQPLDITVTRIASLLPKASQSTASPQTGSAP